MSTFPPRPGTVAYRVLAYLETILPRRPRATAGMIAGELRGITALQVRDALEAAHAAGYVNREAEIGISGRGPVFYELVRNTAGEFAVGGAAPRGDSEAVAAGGDAEADGPFISGSGSAPALGGVIEPVVDPNPESSAPALLMHDPARAIGKVVAIRPQEDGFDADLEMVPDLAAWLRAAPAPAPNADGAKAASAIDWGPYPFPQSGAVVATEPAVSVTVGLDFAKGPDQFAVALSSDGRLHCWRGVVPYVFSRAEARALVDYLNRIDLEPLLEDGP